MDEPLPSDHVGDPVGRDEHNQPRERTMRPEQESGQYNAGWRKRFLTDEELARAMSEKFHDVPVGQYAQIITILKEAPKRVRDAFADCSAARYIPPRLLQYTLRKGVYTSGGREVARFLFTRECELLNVLVLWDVGQLRRTAGPRAYVAKSY